MKRFAVLILILLALVLQVSLVSAGGVDALVDIESGCSATVVDYEPDLIKMMALSNGVVNKSFGSDFYGDLDLTSFFTEVSLYTDGVLVDTYTGPTGGSPNTGWTGQASFTFDQREGVITVSAVVAYYVIDLGEVTYQQETQFASSKSTLDTYEIGIADDPEYFGVGFSRLVGGGSAEVEVDCDTAENPVPSLCPDGRLNTNLCEPIAIYAAQDADGSYTIAVYQSAPSEAVGTYLFQFTSADVAAAQGSNTNVVLGSSGFATAYLTPDGQIVFEAGPDFEGKIFYFAFDAASFPDAMPTTSTNY